MNNSAMPPQNPNSSQTQTPVAPVSNKGDLYDEITKEDEEVVVTPIRKKRQTPFMFLVHFYTG